MKPVELFDTCMDAIDRFNRGEVFADFPFVYLTVPRDRCPGGDRIRLFGRTGPQGRICNVQRRGEVFDVGAVFPAVPIVQALGKEMGVRVRVRRSQGDNA